MATLDLNISPNPGYTREDINFSPQNDDFAESWKWDFQSDSIIDSNNRESSYSYNFDSIYDKFYTVTLKAIGSSVETATGLVGIRNRLNFLVDLNTDYAIGYPEAKTIDLGVTGANRLLDSSSFSWDIKLDSSPYTAISGVTGFSLDLTEKGNYTVELTADDFGVTGISGTTQQKTITTNFKVLNISIDITPNIVKVGDDVNCSITGEDIENHTFRWRFGDGEYADGPNVTHAYFSGGIYDLILVIDIGTENEKILKYNVNENYLNDFRIYVSDISAKFSIDKTQGYYPLTASFFDLTSSSLSLTGWEWSFTGAFGSAQITGETAPQYIYETADTYYPHMRVTDIGGYQSTATGIIELIDSGLSIKAYKGNELLLGNISENAPITLTFVSDIDVEDSIINWKWELVYVDSILGDIIIEDSETTEKENFSFKFDIPEDYLIRIIAEDINGNIFQGTRQITITDNVIISASPEGGIFPLNVNFSFLGINTANNNFSKAKWDFTNDGIYDLENLIGSYTYTAAASYTCKLQLIWIIVDKYNNLKVSNISLEKTKNISVTYPTFSLDIDLDPVLGRKPLTVFIKGKTNSIINTWNWVIDNVPLSQKTQAINHTFTTKGPHIIVLTASDIYSQGPLTVQKVIRVSEKLSTIDESVNSDNSVSIMELEGSVNSPFFGVGTGFQIPTGITSVESSGFKSNDGISLIFD